MRFVIIQASYYIGVEPVTIVTKNPLDGFTYVETSQSELNAARADTAQPWADAELLAVAQAKLPAQFPGVTGIVVELYVPPAPPEPPVEEGA